MIDNLSILLSHALLAFAFWILMNRPELDVEEAPTPDTEPEGFAKKRQPTNPMGRKRSVTPDA